jgi:hypothetical protein
LISCVVALGEGQIADQWVGKQRQKHEDPFARAGCVHRQFLLVSARPKQVRDRLGQGTHGNAPDAIAADHAGNLDDAVVGIIGDVTIVAVIA